MGNDIQKGTVYADGGVGGAGTATAANLNAHVDNATIKATFISSKTLKDPASLSDSLVVENSGVLYRQTHQQIVDLINLTIQGLLPVGSIIDFAGASAPSGWLMCYGQAISRTTYDELFEIIGIVYGAGDSVSTFNLPDLRGRVVAGRDDMGGTAASRLTATYIASGGGPIALGGNGGLETHTLSVSEMPPHQHQVDVPANIVGAPGFTTGPNLNFQLQGYWTQYTGSGVPHNNVQPTIIVNKIIRAQS